MLFRNVISLPCSGLIRVHRYLKNLLNLIYIQFQYMKFPNFAITISKDLNF